VKKRKCENAIYIFYCLCSKAMPGSLLYIETSIDLFTPAKNVASSWDQKRNKW